MSSVTLQPETSRGRNALFLGLFAAFWNVLTYGLFGVFLAISAPGELAGFSGVAFYGFFGIFILVGLIAAVLALRSLLTLRYAPRPVLTLSAASVPAGETATLSWRIDGRRGWVRQLAVSLEGWEEVEHRSDTDSSIDRRVFHRFTLYDSACMPLTTEGRSRVAIPAQTLWHRGAQHSKIIWLIRVRMRLAGLPATSEGFHFAVVPSGAVEACDHPRLGAVEASRQDSADRHRPAPERSSS